MAGLNKLQIIGNLGRDPEMRFTSQGKAVTSFTVAVNRKWSGGEETIWVRVSAWDRLAEICNEYLTKGKQVYIEGRIRQPEVFTDRNGETRTSLEMTATDMVMLGGGRWSSGDDLEMEQRVDNAAAIDKVKRNNPIVLPENQADDDEIPF
jgi:single-strand DNA-binding protein